MDNLVDLHAHILPGLDDGPDTVSGSLEILEALEGMGFSHAFATPHHRLYSWTSVQPDKVEKGVRDVALAAEKRGLNIALLPGMEFDFDDTLEEKAFTLPGRARHLLVDVGFWGVPGNLITPLRRVRDSGIKVLVVHPERNRELCRDRGGLSVLMESGVKLLGNIGSFSGMYGKGVRRDARDLLKEGLYWAMASDMHSGDQSEWIREGIRELLSLAGNGTVEKMMAIRPMDLVKAMGGDR